MSDKKHTQGEWKVDNANNVYVNREPFKIIISANSLDVDIDEADANANLIAAAPIMLGEHINVEHYAKTALNSLDNNVLSEVRGMLEGILKLSGDAIKEAKGE